MPGDAADKMVAAAPPLAAGPGGCGEAGAAGALPDAARWRPRPGRDRVEGALVEGKGREGPLMEGPLVERREGLRRCSGRARPVPVSLQPRVPGTRFAWPRGA